MGFGHRVAVKLFLMGTNRWLGLPDWPPANVSYRPLYLSSRTELGRGRLAFGSPPVDAPPDRFAYDPENPIPSLIQPVEAPPVEAAPAANMVRRVS